MRELIPNLQRFFSDQYKKIITTDNLLIKVMLTIIAISLLVMAVILVIVVVDYYDLFKPKRRWNL